MPFASCAAQHRGASKGSFHSFRSRDQFRRRDLQVSAAFLLRGILDWLPDASPLFRDALLVLLDDLLECDAAHCLLGRTLHFLELLSYHQLHVHAQAAGGVGVRV